MSATESHVTLDTCRITWFSKPLSAVIKVLEDDYEDRVLITQSTKENKKLRLTSDEKKKRSEMLHKLLLMVQEVTPMAPLISNTEETPPPNNIMFVQNLTHDTTEDMLQLLFKQFLGFKEIRMIDAKLGIAFVEFDDNNQSSTEMQSLQVIHYLSSHLFSKIEFLSHEEARTTALKIVELDASLRGRVVQYREVQGHQT
ncbi:unnamed protein product [Lactuca saligna]|uniref:RRM domain-containing protein n=1 Tax=Lactuca saligna TaxID=75948 RepID=A0AA35YMN0_LACSI|nr:unnamed protein product [Lactuca saligna]